MSKKYKSALKKILVILMMTEHSNEDEIALLEITINALIKGDGKITQKDYDTITKALKPLIYKDK